MNATRPLFLQYPLLASVVPFVELADLPTPIERRQLKVGNSKISDNFWIKRDDKTSSVYGGNKVRKLEFIIADLQQRGIKNLVTFGGIGTNHGVATTLFCQKYNINCTIFLFDQPATPAAISNLKLMASLGATLVYKGSLLKTVLHYYSSRLVNSHSTYYLHAGGSNVVGCISYVNAAFELKNQIELGEVEEPDYIYCPVGSSGTLAGLSLGCQLAGLKSKVVGVRVAPSHLGPIPVCTSSTIMKLRKNTYSYLKKNGSTIPELKLNNVELLDSFYGSGYGLTTPKADEAIQCFANMGINLDTTYTAKTAAATIEFCRLHPDKKVLYWHTFNSSDISSLIDENKLASIPENIINAEL